ncbi:MULTISPECIES: M13 family metallopeptidase [Pseudoalteromonas]|uniref:Peptidase M13 n=1 Tax=Pseudoalteromonas amylolytica TaxID=1859457 RepID=A0A1S1N237_9GAMM|nr:MULTISPECIES: M13 family metallopeptidase [Pseudoalteromonas]OHU90717.1 peptidase M13 [Pseudoalteromonas sp. JW3]OHU92664.1 peptidase M13 [Pseudoalteromonas amylolytica]
MNKIKLTAASVAMTLGLLGCSEPASNTQAAAQQQSQQVAKVSGIDLNNIDRTVRAQDDFYYHVNGKWLEKTQIPADKSNYGSFSQLYDESQKALKEILESAKSNAQAAPGSDEHKLGAFYASYIDETAREELGLSPIKTYLSEINAVKDKAELPALMAKVLSQGGNTPFGWYVNNDAKNSTEYALYVYQSGLGLPDRDYYLKDTDKFNNIREEYQQYIEQVFTRLGHKDTKQIAANILALEKAMADAQWTRVESRDATKTYNKMTLAEVDQLMPQFELPAFFNTFGLELKELIVSQPSYLQGLSEIYGDTSLETWQQYLTFHFVNNHATLLNKDMVELKFNFFDKKLRGLEEQAPTWKKAVDASNAVLGELLGKTYVKQHFPPQAKAKMEALVANLIIGFEQAIDDLEWMSAETKIAAKEKLSKFTPKIGYPDKWKDYSALQINRDDLLGNHVRYTQWSYQEMVNKMGKPVDRSEWLMTPQTVNAYYNPVNNEIVFPAAILQPPFFNLAADDAVNYGAIGAVIGHELGHGFDDQGAKYDGDGNLRNWWSESDLAQFEARSKNLVEQFDQFKPFEDANVNGQFTLGENIGDLGGLTVAYKAYQISLGDKKAPVIDGYTGEQRFFMGWSQIWRRKYREEELRNRLVTDPHSPSHYRVIGVLPNMPEFYEAFDVKQGDQMYLAPEQRVKIW